MLLVVDVGELARGQPFAAVVVASCEHNSLAPVLDSAALGHCKQNESALPYVTRSPRSRDIALLPSAAHND